MILECKIITNSSKNEIHYLEEECEKDFKRLKIYITTVPERGKANKMIIKILSKEFKVAKSKIKIIKGEKNSQKVIEIDEQES